MGSGPSTEDSRLRLDNDDNAVRSTGYGGNGTEGLYGELVVSVWEREEREGGRKRLLRLDGLHDGGSPRRLLHLLPSLLSLFRVG